jgi:hypothetical protein
MKILSLVAFILILCISQRCVAQYTEPNDINVLARYITDRQLSTDTQSSNGAIWQWITPRGEDTVYEVIPYFAHCAARGLARTGIAKYEVNAKNWMNWYLAHMDSIGRSVNHYYMTGSTVDSIVSPDDIDAQDADIATFFTLADDYLTATSDKLFFTKQVKVKLETAAKFLIENLIDKDHLSYASETYAMKYTMDNSQVYEGLMALAMIEKEVYLDNGSYNIYRAKAAATQAAIRLWLYDPVSGMYSNSTNTKTIAKNWYEPAGVVATLWPQFCGVESYKSERSAHQREIVSQNFNPKNKNDWTDSSFVQDTLHTYPWASVGYIYSMAGDTAAGHKQLSYVVGLFKDSTGAHCNLEEAGWALMHLATIYKRP